MLAASSVLRAAACCRCRSELTLQLAAAVAHSKVLSSEMTTADEQRAAMAAESKKQLDQLRRNCERRQGLHDNQLAVWERHLARFLEV